MRKKEDMVETQLQQESWSKWWWFDQRRMSDSYQKRSPWLQSTLSDLDEKTKAMLKLIEEDADSFARRADMYYKKRPELISMVEDFYRTHRSLAERYDQFRSESGTRLITPWASPLSMTKCRPKKSMSLSSCMDESYDSYSETYESGEELEESDVEDPEPDEVVQYQKEVVEKEVSRGDVGNGDHQVMRLMEEVERLKVENNAQKELLMQKDEEKRDVIRQLSLAMDLVREENVELRKRTVKDSAKRQKHLEGNKLEVFWRRLFN